MKTVLAISLTVYISSTMAAVTGGQTFANNGKIVDLLSGHMVPWYTCTAQGNYPDPTTCDHYIACTTNLDAYQMPCAMGPNGRLHYVRDSGPVEEESYCDYPESVVCDLDPATTTTREPTTRTTPEPTTANPTTPKPGGKQCEIDGKSVKEGGDCEFKEDCGECGDCDWYLRCDNSNKWVLTQCEFFVNGTGYVPVADKLFWNAGAPVSHGGFCTHWINLDTTTQERYLVDEECKSPCEYKSDDEEMSPGNVCLRRYWFKNPDMKSGVWAAPWETFMCDANTKWDNDKRSCVRCSPSENCIC